MGKKILVLLLLAVLTLVLQACAKKPAAEEPCNFVQNSYKQRVSWGDQAPVTLFIHSSVPGPFYAAIENAVEEWNSTLGRQVLKIGGWTDHTAAPQRDGANIIYFLESWEEDRYFEQARTTVYWNGEHIYEADVRINAKDFVYFWGPEPVRGHVDMESLMVHEFGHVLGLTHTEETESVMARSLPSATLRRTPHKSDIDSARCEY